MATILLLQTSATTNSTIAMVLQIVFIVAIFYFLFIRPQRRQAQQHRALIESLKRGDRVATLGGLVGEIAAINEDVITLKTGEARVVVERNKVARRMNEGPATAEK